VSQVFRTYLDQVYASGRRGEVTLDGQNIFLYQPIPGSGDEVDVAFGVGTTTTFDPVGPVEPVALPTGEVATTTHLGDYSGLADAHAAVIEWCRATGRALTGIRWEVYGHWRDDQPPRTDVYYLLTSPASQH
jgi:hypothetical protein